MEKNEWTMPLDELNEEGQKAIEKMLISAIALDLVIPAMWVEQKYRTIKQGIGDSFGDAVVQLLAWHGRVVTGKEAL